MATRERLLPWDSQPTDGARINGGHWLASSLLFATDGQQGFVGHEPVAPAVRGLASAPVSAAGPLGGIQAWVPDGSGYVRWAIPPRSGNGVTLGVWVQGTASTTNDQVFAVSHATSANGGRSIRRTSTELYVANRVNSGLSNTGDASAAAATASTWQFIVGTFTSDTASDVWLDGVKGPEGSGNSRPVTTVDSVLVGTVIPNGSTFETATTAIKAIGPAYLLDRVLSADEAVLWSQEAIAQPWALFEPQRIWVPVSTGAGGTTISATTGDAAADGVTAAIYQGTVVSAGTGNATADGSAAGVSTTVTISAGVGAAAADGSTASVYSGAGIAASVGNAVADGTTAAVYQGAVISASVGNAAADGAAASITNTSGTTIIATAGNAVADGAMATLQLGIVISGTTGNAVADGSAASITSGVPLARYFDVLSGKIMILKAL